MPGNTSTVQPALAAAKTNARFIPLAPAAEKNKGPKNKEGEDRRESSPP
jgi:hypothetical protein